MRYVGNENITKVISGLEPTLHCYGNKNNMTASHIAQKGKARHVYKILMGNLL
jgi:hypothetical protein